MLITNEILEQGKSSNGAWSKAQLKCLGFDGFEAGWRTYITGKEVPDEKVQEFLKLKDAHLSNITPALFTVLAWDNEAQDIETFEFTTREESDIFCNERVEETGKTVFVIYGEVVAKYYPYQSKRKNGS